MILQLQYLREASSRITRSEGHAFWYSMDGHNIAPISVHVAVLVGSGTCGVASGVVPPPRARRLSPHVAPHISNGASHEASRGRDRSRGVGKGRGESHDHTRVHDHTHVHDAQYARSAKLPLEVLASVRQPW